MDDVADPALFFAVMTDDHFIAQTYLRHFLGKSEMMRGYKKSDGKTFPCHTDDVCLEVDGDVVKDFLSTPTALGDFRRIFEPEWKTAVAAILEQRVSYETKFEVAGYMANLLATTPASVRVQGETYTLTRIEHIRALQEGRRRRGLPVSARAARALSAYDEGRILVSTEPEFIRAKMTRALMHFAWQLYNADWTILRNDTDEAFLTSDNPMAYDDPPTLPWYSKGRLPRYLPITPKCCLLIVPQADRIAFDPNKLREDPQGKLYVADATPARASAINDATIKCAEDLVLSSDDHSDDLARRIASFSSYRLGVQLHVLPEPDGVVQAWQYRSWEPGKEPQVIRHPEKEWTDPSMWDRNGAAVGSTFKTRPGDGGTPGA